MPVSCFFFGSGSVYVALEIFSGAFMRIVKKGKIIRKRLL